MSKFDIPFPELPRTNEGKRICQVVKVKPEALKEYKEVSRVLARPASRCMRVLLGLIKKVPCGCMARGPRCTATSTYCRYVPPHTHIDTCKLMADYSIHYLEPLNLLIAHMRYIGDDYEKDMAVIAADPETHKWWDVSCSDAIEGRIS